MGSALMFVTQLLNVSVPQAMGWSQLEVSLGLVLACAPMAVKVVLMPMVEVGGDGEEGKGGLGGLGEALEKRERERVVKDIETPDYTNLKLVKEEVDGKIVWEVRPLSPAVVV